MGNDNADWTGQQLVELISASGQFLGDTGVPGPVPDVANVTITYGGGSPSGAIALASFKPAASGVAITQRLNRGAFLTGANATISPLFGQATIAGNLLLAWVTANGGEPTTVTAGWAKVVSGSFANRWSAIWIKLNSAGADAAPVFTSAGGTEPMEAQLVEFLGVATAGATEQSVGGNFVNKSSWSAIAPAADAAFGDLVVFGSRLGGTPGFPATFSETLNNNTAVVHAGDSGANALAFMSSFGFGIMPALKAALPLGVRTWEYDVLGNVAPAVGTLPSIVLPASTGKIYRLAMISANLVATTAVAQASTVQVLDGASVIFSRILAAQALINASGWFDLAGMSLKGTIGNSMTVKFATIGAAGQGTLSCGAYLQ